MAAVQQHLFLELPVEFIGELSTAQSVGEILDVVAKWLLTIFHADRASITLANDSPSLQVFALEGNRAIAKGTPVLIEGSMIGRVFSKSQPEICNDLAASSDLDCVLLAAHGLGSCLDAPLRNASRCFGTLNVGRKEKNAFSPMEMRQIEALALWVAAMIRVHRQVERVTLLSETDDLTELFNRRALISYFQEKMPDWQSSGTSVGLAVVDIDFFKKVNDTYGHETGDQVLVYLATQLTCFFRKNDFVARYGGEEFCVIVEHVSVGLLMRMLDRFRKSLHENPFMMDRCELTITVSIGAVLIENVAAEFDGVFAEADAALYSAKRSGRDRVEVVQGCGGG